MHHTFGTSRCTMIYDIPSANDRMDSENGSRDKTFLIAPLSGFRGPSYSASNCKSGI